MTDQLIDGRHRCQSGRFGLHGFHEHVTGVAVQRRKGHVVRVRVERVADGAAARVGARVGDGAGDGEIQLGLPTLHRVIHRKTAASARCRTAAATAAVAAAAAARWAARLRVFCDFR